MNIFWDLVTVDLNCWFTVKADICNLRLHDCTRQKTSDHKDFLPPENKQANTHINPGKLWKQCALCIPHGVTITTCLRSPVVIREMLPHKRLHYPTHARITVTKSRTMLKKFVTDEAALWSSVLTPAGERGGGVFVLTIVILPCPPFSQEWP